MIIDTRSTASEFFIETRGQRTGHRPNRVPSGRGKANTAGNDTRSRTRATNLIDNRDIILQRGVRERIPNRSPLKTQAPERSTSAFVPVRVSPSFSLPLNLFHLVSISTFHYTSDAGPDSIAYRRFDRRIFATSFPYQRCFNRSTTEPPQFYRVSYFARYTE